MCKKTRKMSEDHFMTPMTASNFPDERIFRNALGVFSNFLNSTNHLKTYKDVWKVNGVVGILQTLISPIINSYLIKDSIKAEFEKGKTGKSLTTSSISVISDRLSKEGVSKSLSSRASSGETDLP